ncbi:MAG TPA: hypothetical protein VJV96_13715 [Candidatus Angelobacter sp.]|nr:hypothetical protein [Candidatus Angelobacter sp.]
MTKAKAKKATKKKLSAKKKTEAEVRGAAPEDFQSVFDALRQLLSVYEDRLACKSPNPGYYYLESTTPTHKKRPMAFAAVRTGKNYVSYHLVPVYAAPELGNSMSPELKKRMQGKGCFNFTTVDETLFRELESLTEAGYKNFKKRNWL